MEFPASAASDPAPALEKLGVETRDVLVAREVCGEREFEVSTPVVEEKSLLVMISADLHDSNGESWVAGD